MQISRRRFLTLGTLALSGVAVGFFRHPIELLVDKLQYNTSPYATILANGTAAISSAVMLNILALAYIVIAWKEGKDQIRKVTEPYILSRCQFEPGAFTIYNTTSKLLNDYADRYDKGTFDKLDLNTQIKIVTDIMPPLISSRKSPKHVINLFFRYSETLVAESVVSGILDNFYSSTYATDSLAG